MRRFPPPRSDARRASPAPSSGRKKQPRIALPRGKPPRSWPLAANGVARCAAAPGRAPKSPPSMRGKGRGLDGHALGIRIAPAHAGNACSDRLFLFLDRITPAHAGNCPVLRNPGRNAAPRITPARAGKRRPSHVYSQPFWDHPRPCGEKLSTKDFIAPPSGSPPRMREKVEDKVREYKAQRITPAYAGKSATTTWARTVGGDHPRVCGEKLEPVYQVAAVPGSPPRVRGKVEGSGYENSASRITPACAGKSQGYRSPVSAGQDHPRVCGEKRSPSAILFRHHGSPPRVRGKGMAWAEAVISAGITPACAGKSPSLLGREALFQDHPRVCGEKRASPGRESATAGSPPRVRGKEFGGVFGREQYRITPACAGKR